MIRAVLTTCRPTQWTKNLLVAAAPLAAGTLLHPHVLLRTLLTFVVMTLAAAAQDRPLGRFGTYQVVRRADDQVIGDVGFMGPPDATGAVHVGCAITEDARGQGYATEALSAVLDWARTQSGLTCVLADTTRANLASQRLLERVGLHRVGEDGELIYYML